MLRYIDMQDLENYHFYEDDWDSYESLYKSFSWQVPAEFNMADYICGRWANEKNTVAIFDEDADGNENAYTYWQIDQMAKSLANHLSVQGVDKGDRVAVQSPQRPETAIAHIAIWKLGAVSVPLSTLFGPDAIHHRVNDAEATATIVDTSALEEHRRANLKDLVTTLVIDSNGDLEPGERDFRETIEKADAEFESRTTASEDPAVIMYTSGTTGAPKGAVLPHRSLLGNLPLYTISFANLEITNDDVMWTPAEWAWVASVFTNMATSMFYQVPLLAYQGRFDPEKSFKLIEKYGVTMTFLPPTSLRMMRQASGIGEYSLEHVRVISSGGESLSDDLKDWIAETFDGPAVHETYGQTEANASVGECDALFESRPGKTGRPIPGFDVQIVSPDDGPEKIYNPGEVGEIAVKHNPVCMTEYWRSPEKTEQKIRDGWVVSGDLASKDEDEYIEYQSRKDDVIMSSGRRIGPDEIEASLESHDSIVEAGVIGIPDNELGEVPKAFVVLKDGVEVSTELREDLQKHVKDRLAKYEYPREIEFVDELPKTATGKIRRVELRSRAGVE